MALGMLYTPLKRSNTLPELVQFLSNHAIDPTVQKHISDIRVWRVDVVILAFLSVSPMLEYSLINSLI